jgi:hypothetical protein
MARAEEVELDGVADEVITLQIEYLASNDAPPVADFRTSVDLSQGHATIADPAFVVADDPVVFSFVSFGCNRVGNDQLANNSPSSANIGQLTQDFAEITDSSHLGVLPDYVFFTGDLVQNLAPGIDMLSSQLEGWKAVYASTPLGSSSIPLIAVAGNHELLVQVTVTATPAPMSTPGSGQASSVEGNSAAVTVQIPNPPTGAVFTSEMADFIPAANGPTVAPPNPDHVERDESMLSFSFRDGANLFIVVDTDTYTGGDTPEVTGFVPLNWLTEQLDAANSDSTIENIFVFGHRPIDSPDPNNLPIAPSQALPFYELLAAPTATGAPTKVRVYICAHAHLWNEGVPSTAPLGSTLVQVIAGNGGSPVSSAFTPPIYYGYTLFSLTQAGDLTAESWGRPVPVPYAAPPPQPTTTLREQLTIYVAPSNER